MALCILVGWLPGGCVLAPPSSEALIFDDVDASRHPKELFSPSASSVTGQENNFRYISNPKPLNVLFSISFRPPADGELEYAKQKFAPFIKETLAENITLGESDLTVRNSYYFSLSFPITLLNRKKIRWALNVGFPVLGTDATTNLAPNTYITANLGFGDGEIILQQKITQHKAFGIALGGYYRAERRGFEIKGDKISLIPFKAIKDRFSADRIFYNHIIGGRINAFWGKQSKSYLLFRVAPGYALNFQQFVLNFSFSFHFGS